MLFRRMAAIHALPVQMAPINRFKFAVKLVRIFIDTRTKSTGLRELYETKCR